LPNDLLAQTTKSGGRLIKNRIAWGKSYLKKGGLVHYPQRGFVQITERGKQEQPENVSLEKIQSDVITFHTIILIDGSKLVDLMHKFNVGLQVKSYYEVKVLDNDFFDTEEI